ncbi:MAG: hypothetical protein ACI857_001649 [Arenicella sp.]|jgi:hypothetical protein
MKNLIAIFILTSINLHSFAQTIAVNEKLELLKTDSTDWTYPWHVIKHKDGHFENTFGLPITQSDTAHVLKNAQVFVYILKDLKEVKYRIPFAEATIDKDTILIELNDESASNFEGLSIKIFEGEFELEYHKAYIQMLANIKVEFLEQKVTLSQSHFEVGEEIKGEVFVIVKETVEWPDQTVEIIEKTIRGSFVTTLSLKKGIK